MNKRWRHIMGAAALAAMGCACTSATDEVPEAPSYQGRAQVSVSLTLSLGDALPGRAFETGAGAATAQENAISVYDLRMPVYDESGANLGEISIQTMTPEKDDKDTYTLHGVLNVENAAALTGIRVVVLANCHIPLTYSFRDISLEDLPESLTYTFGGPSFSLADDRIPMTGISDKLTTSLSETTVNDIGRVDLLRAMAKVSVSLDKTLEGYTLTQVVLHNYNTQGYCAPKRLDDISGNDGETQNGDAWLSLPPHIPATTGKGADLTATTGQPFVFYVPEYNNTSTENPVSYLTVTLEDENDITTDYPISFTFTVYDENGTSTEKALDILRNHHYQYVITKVGETFSYTLYEGEEYTKTIEVEVKQLKWLWVKDKVLYMNNVSSIFTEFDSSASDLTYKISDISENFNESDIKVYIDQAIKGEITIESPVPDNFVPKSFKVKIYSQTDPTLSETIQVYQYPPLYISSETSGETWNDDKGQNNKNMYTIKALLTDLSDLPTPDDDKNYTGNVNEKDKYYNYYKENGEDKLRWDLRESYVEYLKTAVFGYPLTEKSVESFSTTGETSQYYTNVTVIKTEETEVNNRLISPNFMLASQAGMNSPSDDYDDKVKFCKHYMEKNNDGSTYGPGCWRVPTKAELILIDVLQNIKKCAVKDILEGGAYWNATKNVTIMLDPRTGDGYDTGAVRCVRDIK